MICIMYVFAIFKKLYLKGILFIFIPLFILFTENTFTVSKIKINKTKYEKRNKKNLRKIKTLEKKKRLKSNQSKNNQIKKDLEPIIEIKNKESEEKKDIIQKEEEIINDNKNNEIKNEYQDYFSGFSIGFGAAYDVLNNFEDTILNNRSFSGSAFNNGLNKTNLPEDLKQGILAFINLGYGKVFLNHLFIGLEIEGGYRFLDNHSTTTKTPDGRYSYYINQSSTIDWNLAGILKIGFAYDKNLIYILGGYDVLRLNFNYSYITTFTNNTGPLTGLELFGIQESSSVSTFIHGFRVGLGIERVLFSNKKSNISFNIEAYYKQYFSKDLKLGDTFAGNVFTFQNLSGFTVKCGLKIHIKI